MARRRIIDPDFFTDKKVVRLPVAARYLWMSLISQSDDEGIVECDPHQINLRSGMMLQVEEVEQMLGQIFDIGLAVPYGEDLCFLPNFFKHQKLDRPSLTKHERPPLHLVARFPQYIEGWVYSLLKKWQDSSDSAPHPYQNMPENTDDSTRTRRVIDEDSTSDRRGLVLNRIEEKGREENRREETHMSADADEPAAKKKPNGYPDWFEAYYRQALDAYPPGPGRERTKKAQVFRAVEQLNGDRPDIELVVGAIGHYSRTEDWRREGGRYIPAMERFFSNRMWENVPSRASPDRDYTKPVQGLTIIT